MASNRATEKLFAKLETIKDLAKESEVLLKAQSPDVEQLLAVMNPSDRERDLSDTFQLAVQELLEYFRERVRLQGKVADAAALKHLRQE